jgi:hypothetical protein
LATQLSRPLADLHASKEGDRINSGPEDEMNGTFFDIDRNAYVKIVLIALCAAISVVAIAIALH